MADDPKSGAEPSASQHREGLLLIGLFKLSKALLSIVLGIAALHLLHRDVSVFILHVSELLKLDPDSRVVTLLISHAGVVSVQQLRRFSILTFGYAIVCLVEGTGLVLEKRWAEYFTTFLTTLGLPWECFELFKEFTWVRISLLVVNLAVLAYLIWHLRKVRRRRAAVAAK